MPCWTTRSQAIEWKGINIDTLAAALRALGARTVEIKDGRVYAFDVTGADSVTWQDGRLNITSARRSDILTTAGRLIRQAYTKEAFRVAATRAGFTVEQDAQSAAKMTARRRAY
jgi:hypothetical protein